MSLSSLVQISEKIFADKDCSTEVVLNPLPGLFLMRDIKPRINKATVYEPLICLIIQGCKEVTFGDREKVRVEAGSSIIVSHTTPVTSGIKEINSLSPYIAVVFLIDIRELRLICHEINSSFAGESLTHSLRAGRADDALIDAFERYLKVADNQQEAEVLAPLIRKEIHFRLLTSSHGSALRELANNNSQSYRIMKAIHHIKENFNKSLSIAEVAEVTAMSLPSFYNHFKSVTGISPLQYQKELRLIKAQELLKKPEVTATSVAFEVGYESPSQFSREFVRRFGITPKGFSQS